MWSSRRNQAGKSARRRAAFAPLIVCTAAVGGFITWTQLGAQGPAGGAATAAATMDGSDPNAFVQQYCVGCHSQRLKVGGLALEGLDASRPAEHPEVWERVVTKLSAGAMPPAGSPRPGKQVYDAVTSGLVEKLDAAWLSEPDPGRIGAVHRLNRMEYNNAIRDILDLEDVDVRALLPGDETADGSFDNFADVLSISTAHLERYLSVSRQITRLAVGLPPDNPVIETYEIPLHVVQDSRQSEELPFGTRGGMAIDYNFPGRRRVLRARQVAAPVSGLHQGHGLAANAGRPPGWQAGEALQRGR